MRSPDLPSRADGFPWGQGELYYPRTLSLHLTDLCNSRCVFCGAYAHGHQQDEVITTKILQFLEDHRGQEWTAVNIHGGEPTIRPDFLTILKTIRDLGYEKIIIQTNAIKMADPKFAAEVHRIGVDIFSISFHGHTPQLQDRITGVSQSFTRAIQGIKNIKRADTRLRLTTVVCKLNYAFLPKIGKLALAEGVDHLNICALLPDGSAALCSDDLLVTYSEAAPYIKETIDFAVKAGQTVTLEAFPYCALRGRELYQINWENQVLKVLYRDLVLDDHNRFVTASVRSKGEKCRNCRANSRCVGVYTDYIKRYGWEEFIPY
jgi:MoaA/NifB/PqqE/SkfB family radical SAM enzyme